MKPPFKITPTILNLVSDITHLLGRLESIGITAPEPKLRKKNKVRTIKSTLAIEGNTCTEEQITHILEGKRVVGSKKEITEVKNANKLYESLEGYKSESLKSFLAAHKCLMDGLVATSGAFRSKNVGVLKGKIVKHVAPKPNMLPELMNHLFNWLKKERELHPLIKSCIAHYEIEFIHPFEDGNGRMGRFWQTLILTEYDPIFKHVPIESVIEKHQQEYYDALEKSDKAGTSGPFIEFMLAVILESLKEFDSQIIEVVLTSEDRLLKAKEYFKSKSFSRKNYMELFKNISSATASRDLKEALDKGLLKKSGEKNQARYRFE